jgi:hypothetical protein
MLRSAEARNYLYLKAEMRSSDSNARFRDGRVLPVFVWIKDGKELCMVEIEYHFWEAERLPGFIGWQRKPAPEPVVEQSTAPAVPVVEKPKSYQELVQQTEKQHRAARAELYNDHKSQNTAFPQNNRERGTYR